MRAVIFGGSGFIGTFFAKYLIENHAAKCIYLFDCEPVLKKNFEFRKRIIRQFPEIKMVQGDVTDTIHWQPSEEIDLVANFAAIHREPGHEDHEYYRCNLLGAENVCDWAEKIGCQRILFTSSISPYGQSEAVRDEKSLPTPSTAYGGSKLVAEKIHRIWQSKKSRRQLVIVRPGVVFGPGEGGNVSRLIHALRYRYFFYMGNRNTRKAGVYVKELCRAMMWVLDTDKSKKGGATMFNMSMNPGPSINEYVDAICKVGNYRVWVPSLPSWILFAIAYSIEFITKPLGIVHPISPVRIRKLMQSNNILPSYLIENGYDFKYSLEEALADWKNEWPNEWH